MRTPAIALFLTLLLAMAPAAMAPAAMAADEHMEIVADATTYDGKAHLYRVSGNVKITLPEIVVTCREATVYADAAETKIVKVVFTGGVTASKGTDTFRAERISYLVAERRLVAEGGTRTKLKLPARQGAVQAP